MKTFIISLALILFSVALFAQKESEYNYEKDQLAFELCGLYTIDQSIRTPEIFKLLGRNMIAFDSINFSKFIKFVKKNGFPNKKMVGEHNWSHPSVSGVGFMYLVHNPNKVATEYYDLFKTELEKGNLSPALFSYALDRYYVSTEGRSYFDTPYKARTTANGVCLQDKEKSDKLRKEIGLEPLPQPAFIDCSEMEIKKADMTKPIIVSVPE